MKIALGQINTTVGALHQNAEKILDYTDRAKSGGASLALFPELAITGYPPKDLLEKSGFVEENVRVLNSIAEKIEGIAIVVGFVEPNPARQGKPFFNSAAVIRNKKIISVHRKSLLPTYDVFDEGRYFEPAKQRQLLILDEHKIGVTICEDVWNDKDFAPSPIYSLDPVQVAVETGAEFIINISSSPYHLEKWDERRELLRGEAMKYRKHVVYVNLVGGNDELIFDGRSVIFSPDGELKARARDFEEDLLIADIDSLEKNVTSEQRESNGKCNQSPCSRNPRLRSKVRVFQSVARIERRDRFGAYCCAGSSSARTGECIRCDDAFPVFFRSFRYRCAPVS